MNIFLSVEALLAEAEKNGLPIWELVMRFYADESGVSTGDTWRMMSARLDAMRDADASYDPSQRSRSGLTGGDGERMRAYAQSGKSITGDFLGEILSAALRMGECNACMHRIVAAPTAGACGVLPAVLLPYGKKFGVSDDELVKALFVASAFGGVIATRASISGAECGCQAEIGTACSMAAAALAELNDMSLEQIEYAAEIALEHHLGLTCDPICGLVQIPCIERNAVAAMRAINACNLSWFLWQTRNISFDMVVKTMYQTGINIANAFRETSEGGLARLYRRQQ